jgi:hypothetical protein
MMNDPALTCKTPTRREKVRSKDLNGLDYLEVGDDQLTLTVYFLGKAPDRIEKENVRIQGGRRVTGIRVVDLQIHSEDEPDLDDRMDVVVNRPGDFSTYTLRVAELDEDGRLTEDPMQGFDPRYSRLEFSFKAGCPSDLDCKTQEPCPPPEREEPEIDYLAKDYASFRTLILDRLALVMPDWHERHAADLGIALVEVLAYIGDHLSYYQDAVATEAYLETARQRASVRRHARLVDYQMHDGCNARAWVCVNTSHDIVLDPNDIYFITEHDDAPDSGAELDGRLATGGRYEVFEPLTKPGIGLYLYEQHKEIPFYTWGEELCCLPQGATSATLEDRWVKPDDEHPDEEYVATSGSRERQRSLHLKEGDILIFEEVIGPGTGEPADADPTHRHAVRLTRVEPGEDALFDQPVVQIEWSPEDALPFPLCLSAVGPAPACELIENVSVARGNVVLADHGQTVGPEDLGTVPEAEVVVRCGDECHPLETVVKPRRFRPSLKEGPQTFSQDLPVEGPASELLKQDPRQVMPWIKELLGTYVGPDGAVDTKWTVRRDLLGSGSQDRHFVAEPDNEGRSRLRFGDGDLGRMPEAGTMFKATYRVGNGPSGNVGAEAITRLVFRRNWVSGVELRSRNPLPARGGTPPESMTEAKLLAPHTFRTDLQRAITAEDYARLAERHPKVQRAVAALRWTGTWYEVLVAIDPRSGVGTRGELATGTAAFADAVRQTVERYLDLEEFHISSGGEMADRVVGILRRLRAAVERDEPPKRLVALVRESLAQLREEHDRAAARDYERLEPWTDRIVAGLDRAMGIAPEHVTDAPEGDPLLQEIEEYLYSHRRIGHDLFVTRAEYVPLDIALEVCVLPNYLRGHVKAAMLDLFSNRTLPDGRRGFFHPDNLSFGDDIFLSRLVSTAQAVTGVESVRVTRLQRLFEEQNREIETGVLALNPFEIARLDNDPSSPEDGQLLLEMRGGR